MPKVEDAAHEVETDCANLNPVEIARVIGTFADDPPDTPFQHAYLRALWKLLLHRMPRMTYHVKEIRAVSRIHADMPVLASGFPRRSAAEAWLIDYLRQHKLPIIGREVDTDNNAIDFMTGGIHDWRQFAVEPEAALN